VSSVVLKPPAHSLSHAKPSLRLPSKECS